MKPLSGFTILDFSHRLPGPLAGKVLADLGAEVIKIEDEVHQDPFLSGFFNAFDPAFKLWYEELNANKKIIRLNFKSPQIKADIQKYLKNADGILLSLSPKLKINLGLDPESLKSSTLAVIEMESSKDFKLGMHDLNAMAMSGLLSLYLENKNDVRVEPPFLPIAGISFGQQVATHLLSLILQSKKTQSLVWDTAFLYDSIVKNLNCFWPKSCRDEGKTKFLHNGAFPCYNLYKLKDDNYVALAAVEEKFWEGLLQTFPISLQKEHRFDTDNASFDKISGVFIKLTAGEVQNLIKDKDLCLSIVYRSSP